MKQEKQKGCDSRNVDRRSFLTGLAAASVGVAVSPTLYAANTAGAGGASAIAPTLPTAGKSPLTTLNNGVEMPVLGVGCFNLPTIQTADVIHFALINGYRLVDTAKNYGNEKEVGEGIVRSGVPRSELFITTKLWIEDFGYDEALRAFDRSVNELGLDYLDLYLLHWPVPTDFAKTIAAYKALEKLYADKRIRAIGVSNFNPEHLRMLTEQTEVVPVLNQIELHPFFAQQAAREANEQRGIKTESWSPIGGGFITLPKDPTNIVRLLEERTIVELGQKYRKMPAQIVLRWHIQHGFIAIPKSQHYERLLANIAIFDFELSADEMASVDALNRDLRAGPDPELFDVPAFRAILERRRAGV
ncbi:MAG: aldo/keto reductase [Kiritimatiellae bacterium]|nr:aldo/keto reductase [Kiritimatiellia bacterium]MCO5062775.1 aldo/keto reductase [Kiritimatiellia bacterium]